MTIGFNQSFSEELKRPLQDENSMRRLLPVLRQPARSAEILMQWKNHFTQALSQLLNGKGGKMKPLQQVLAEADQQNDPPQNISRGSLSSDVSDHFPVVVIVGGGFGGLAAAKALRNAPVQVILIDRTNHHLFQPLLYQVATSELSPGHIGSPIRSILHRQRNTTVLLGEVIGIDKIERSVVVSNADQVGARLHYDYLILATGSTHSYFGHEEFRKHAPGLKNLADAVAVRNKILSAFEVAEAEENPRLHRDLLTFVLVGAGPTGVEMASAIAVLVRNTLPSEFRRIDPASARIVLIDRFPRVLGSFSDELSAAATKHLQELGVEVLVGRSVEIVDATGVIAGGERIVTNTVIWTAGVAPSPAAKWLNAESDHAGRVRVKKDLSVAEHPEIFVVGDTATFEEDGKPLPGVAQVALQQGRYAGRLIASRIAGKPVPGPFRYFDKGDIAVVGKGFAVLQSGPLHLSGFLAWLAWAGVHLQFLAQSNLRVSVFIQWVWTYLTGQRGSRLIVNHYGSEPVGASCVPDPAGLEKEVSNTLSPNK
jgi:NADH:ubiquinone reductase (H+-translocating)